MHGDGDDAPAPRAPRCRSRFQPTGHPCARARPDRCVYGRGRRPPRPAHSSVVGDVVQLVLDLSLDLGLDLDLDLRWVVGVQGGRVEIAGEDRLTAVEEVDHFDLVDVARAGRALHVALTHTPRIADYPAH